MSTNVMTKSMKLKRVLGFTSSSRNSFTCQPNSENLIYIAGCIVVVSNPRLKTQNHLVSISKQSITALAVTDDGRYLATSNCGSKAQVHVWDLQKLSLVVELPGHQAGASSLCFSPNNQFLVTVGSEPDSTLNVWDWQQERLVAEHQLTDGTRVRAVSFAADGSYFVSAGEAHLKFWQIQYSDDAMQKSEINQRTTMVNIEIRGARLGDQRGASFCDVKCGRGTMASSTFCITKAGLLCELNSQRILHKWVDLRVAGANSLSVSENIIVVGCSNGIVRCFNTTELKFLRNLPRPHPLGQESFDTRRSNKATVASNKYPDLVCTSLNETLCSIACVYNDRSIYLWDFLDINLSGQVLNKYSVQYHSSCIWGIDMCQSSMNSDNGRHQLPAGSFITCSSDNTLHVWSPRVFSSTLTMKNSKSLQASRNINGNELQKIIFTDQSSKSICNDENQAPPLDDSGSLSYDNSKGLRCLKISPNGCHLAVGSRSGAIRIFDLKLEVASSAPPTTNSELKCIAAHDAEVLCLEYSDPRKFAGFCYLASSSRDKLIHIFDAANNYQFLQTIDDHLSSITSIRFINNRARGDSLQLISCGADQKLIFRNGLRQLSGQQEQLNFVSDQQIDGKSTFYDMELDSESSCLMAACQDSMIRLYNLARIKYQSSFNGTASPSTIEGGAEGCGGATLIKIALDPSCTFLATSSTNKTLSIYDYQRGECIASVTSGLSDLVTDMKFSPDGRYLVTCSGDGCIFIWKSPVEIVNALTTSTTTSNLLESSSASPAQIACESGRELQHLSPAITCTSPTTTYKSAASRNLLTGNGGGELAQRRGLVASGDDDESLYLQQVDDHGPRSLAATGLDDYDDENSNTEDDDDDVHYGAVVKGDRVGDQLPQSTHDSAEFRHQSSLVKRTGRLRQVSTVNKQLKAKLFQSRDNLDRIASRERFVSEGMTQMDSAKPTCNNNNNSSLSGLFAAAASRRQASDRLEPPEVLSPDSSTLNSTKQQQSDGDSALGAMLASLSSGLVSGSSPRQGSQIGANLEMHNNSNNNTTDRDAGYFNSMSLNRLQHSSSSARRNSASSGANPSSGYHTLQQHRNQSSRAGATRYSAKTRLAGLRNSKSECNLVAGADADPEQNEETNAENNIELLAMLDNLPTCEKLDLAQVNLSSILNDTALDCYTVDDYELLSRQQEVLCQYVVDELQTISKFVTRLHQRVIQAGSRSNIVGDNQVRSKQLSNLLARGVQNSMDILSIVQPSPARSRSNQQHMEYNLQQQHQHQHQQQQHQNRFQSQVDLNPCDTAQVYAQARRQPLRSGSSSLGLFTGDPAAVKSLAAKPKGTAASGQQQNKVSKSSNNNNNIRVDQVLEAYSDRLFRMVQDRMMMAEQQQKSQNSSASIENHGPALEESLPPLPLANDGSRSRESAIYLANNQT